MRPLPSRLAADRRVRAAGWAGLAVVMGVGAVVPFWLSNSQTFLLTGIVTLAILAVSVSLLTGTSGQISLGQVAFLGLGAAVAHQVTTELVAAVPARRAAGRRGRRRSRRWPSACPRCDARGLFLAVTTLGFALVTQNWLLGQDWMAGVGATLHRPEIWRRVVLTASTPTTWWPSPGCCWRCSSPARSCRARWAGRWSPSATTSRRRPPSASTPPAAKLLAFAVSGFIAAVRRRALRLRRRAVRPRRTSRWPTGCASSRWR